MAQGRQAATVRTTIANIEASRGPQFERYAIPLDAPNSIFKWIVGDATTADSINILSHQGGTNGRWVRQREDIKGTDLTDAAANINVAGNRYRRLLAAVPLTANRILTLQTTGAVAGDIITITRLGLGAYTLTLLNGGSGAGNVFVLPISEAWFADVYFDGTDWLAMRAGQLP